VCRYLGTPLGIMRVLVVAPLANVARTEMVTANAVNFMLMTSQIEELRALGPLFICRSIVGAKP
jgi:hypothetical protein